MKLKVTFEKSIELLKTIPHNTCKQAIKGHWEKYKISEYEVKGQGVCWLFCWAKDGKGKKEAEMVAREVFNKIFKDIMFDSFASKVTHEFAKCARNSPGNICEELEKLGLPCRA